MAFKLIEAAQRRWRAVNAPHLVALIRAGARFERGKLIERETTDSPDKAVRQDQSCGLQLKDGQVQPR